LKIIAIALALFALFFAACDEPQKVDPLFSGNRPAQPQTGASGAQPGAAASASASASASSNLPPLPTQEFTEADFTETDKSRDPFRTFAKAFVQQAKGRVTVQRVILADRFALDELKPVGIVSRGDLKALLTDPTGLGWIIKIGDYVGKAEVIHTGGPTGSDVAINWRVDRIRENDIVFVREDPSHPEIPPSTRVVLLYPTDQTPGAPGGPPPVTQP
jgi:type IV pilus assembly protein PilP